MKSATKTDGCSTASSPICPSSPFQRVLPDAKRLYAYHYARYHAEALGGVLCRPCCACSRRKDLTVGLCGYGHLHEAPLFTEGSPYGRAAPASGRARKGRRRPHGELPVTRLLAESTFFLAPRFENSCRELVEGYSKAYHKLLGNLTPCSSWTKRLPVRKDPGRKQARASIWYDPPESSPALAAVPRHKSFFKTKPQPSGGTDGIYENQCIENCGKNSAETRQSCAKADR